MYERNNFFRKGIRQNKDLRHTNIHNHITFYLICTYVVNVSSSNASFLLCACVGNMSHSYPMKVL